MQNWETALQTLDGAYADATMRAYQADVQAYVAWCEDTQTTPFPTTTSQICAFLEDEARDKAPSTVRRRLYALRKIHSLLRLPDPTKDEAINLTLRRMRKRKLARPKQARGLTAQDLERLLDVQPTTCWGLRNAAMLSLGYELMTRRSELVALRDEDLSLREDGTLRVLIRRSKTDQEGQGRVAFTSADTAQRVRDWQDWRGGATNWLFCPIYQDHPIDRPLNNAMVKTIIKTSAKRAGYSAADVRALSGHSLRVGAAQNLLKRGFDTVAIMRAGGWKSASVLARYVELAEHNVWDS